MHALRVNMLRTATAVQRSQLSMAGRLTAVRATVMPRTLSVLATRAPATFSQQPQMLGRRYESSSAAAVLSRISDNTATSAAAAAPSVDPEAIEETRALTRFDEVDALHSGLKRAIQKEFGYETMSPVQSSVLGSLPINADLLVRAETGTGKTLAFLLPAINEVLAAQTIEDRRKGRDCKILIVSPTRELAMQIAEEARRLCYGLRMSVSCFVGGENRRNNVRDIMSGRLEVLVGTPGRLEDLLQSERALRDQLPSLNVLILDEADTLLEMGFRDALTRIIEYLPKTRRTMLFSATLSKEVRGVSRLAFTNEHKFIDSIGHDQRPKVPERIKQGYLKVPFEEQPEMLRRLLAWHLRGEGRLEENMGAAPVAQAASHSTDRSGRSRHGRVDHPGKVVVFFPTTKGTILYANMFRNLGMRNIFEIHSKRDQKQRQRVAERFREANGPAILFTSDVSARGVDYPGVTLVVQMGMPMTSDQYVHRSGRTGRAGQYGRAISVYSPLEEPFAKSLSVMGLEHDGELENHLAKVNEAATAGSDSTGELALSEAELRRERLSEESMAQVKQEMDPEEVREAYTAFLGFYVGRASDLHLRDKNVIIQSADSYARGFGLAEPPRLSQAFLDRIGFSARSLRSNDRSRDSSSSFGRRGGFGGGRDQSFGRRGGFGGDRERSFGGDRERSFGGDRERSFGGARDRGFGGGRDRGFGGGRERSFGGDRDRSFGGDRGRGFGGDRSTRPERSESNFDL